ncbi:TIM44-related membrane protein TimA [Caulobacter sp. NIBR2454]|uniref:TIM44-related membrane protein TimA n=1 Tax=Caulobacter sp. NIBR2454 TaxID=3015996 RepID=UPI0022B64416|nr:TIM44-related membrane protein TimA [Caulobacter sp. NIBR2454]
MQALELIIFAVLAAVVLYQLYSVLGRRVGRQPEDNPAPVEAPRGPVVVEPSRGEEADLASADGLAALRARDPAFDVGHFLGGARQAYEMVVRGFAAGDRDTLRPLLSPQVMEGFEGAIAAREAENRTETVEFLHPPRADFESAAVRGDLAQVVVRFLAEFRSRTRGPEGEGVDDRRTAELWTFERDLKSRDPNWILVNVDAAAA